MDHRDSPPPASTPGPAGPGPTPAPTVPGPRRPALARLGLAVVGATLLVLGGTHAAHVLVGWLHRRPEYQLPSRRIELDPPPPAWIRSGATGLLERVGAQARWPEPMPVQDLDLQDLARDFRTLCPWVARVRRPRGVERAYPNRLVVRLEYREPVAEVRIGPSTFILDGDAVILPADDLDRDAAGPLVPLHGLDPPADGRPGIQWGTEVDGLAPPDPRAAAAARLASFLKARLRPGSAAAAPFRRLAVTSCADDGSLWVRADGRYWIAWGDPPGAEGPGRPTAAEKWDQLRDWVRRGGGSARRADPDAHDYLDFTRAGVVVRRGKPRTP